MGKNFKVNRDLDLDRTMPNVELIRGLFISYNIFEFQDPRPFIFLSYRAYTQTARQTDRQRRQVLYTCSLNPKYNFLFMPLIGTKKDNYTFLARFKPQI